MILNLVGVRKDGSIAAGTIPTLEPVETDIIWPRGEDGTLKFTVKNQDQSVHNLTGGAVVFAVRKYPYDTSATISRQATITDAVNGKCEVAIVQADTLSLLEEFPYIWDLEYTDASGKRWQLCREAHFFIDPIVARPTDPVTPPTPTTPLALGPSWLTVQDQDEWQTDGGTSELVGPESVVNFDDIVPATMGQLLSRLACIARVTGGTGTIRARYGGTPGVADGAVLVTMDPITVTAEAAAQKQTNIAKPSGLQLVKITMQQSTVFALLTMRAVNLVMRGTP